MRVSLYDEPVRAEADPLAGVSLWLPCVPPKTSHHAKRIVRLGRFSRLADRPELVAAKVSIDALLLPHQIPQPVPGPIALALAFTWPWRTSDTKRTRALGCIPHTSKPDCDNLAKTMTDRLAALRFIENDASVADLRVTKWYGETPGILVVIRTLGI